MTDLLTTLDALIPGAMEAWNVPGLAIAVVKGDEVIVAKGYGVCEVGKSAPVDEHSIFAIGSNTKAFTATALGLLVQEGKIRWDDPVVNYLTDFQLSDPYVTRTITVRDLLCHRSGLPTWGGDLMAWGSRYSRAEILKRIRHIPPAFSFRGGYGYSNLMFLAAGQIIPAVTGITWEEFIQQRLFQPLGMTRSTTRVDGLSALGNVALPHEPVKGERRVLPYRPLDGMAPAGAINSTVRDLAQWLRLQLNQGRVNGAPLVDAAVIEETRTPHTPMPIPPAARKLFPSRHFAMYALGWALMDYHGRLLVRHTGGIDGMLSTVGFLPEAQLGITVLTNYLPHGLMDAAFFTAVDAALEVAPQDWNKLLLERDQAAAAERAAAKQRQLDQRVSAMPPSLPLSAYVGTYTSAVYGDAAVTDKGGHLALQLLAHPASEGNLEHWHYDTFLCHWNDPVWDESLVPFITDGQGKVQEFRLKVREDWIDPLEYVFIRRNG